MSQHEGNVDLRPWTAPTSPDDAHQVTAQPLGGTAPKPRGLPQTPRDLGGASGSDGDVPDVPSHFGPLPSIPDAGWIRTERLAKRFRKVQAVRGIDLALPPGEIYGLIGPDGAGKTTTIRMLAGVLRPTSGIARVNGFDVSREAERIRLGVGYMAQRFGLYGDLSVRENLEFYAEMFGVRGTDREDQIRRLLRFARLEEFQNRAAGVLSGGMKKKLALACALIHRPQILLLDEPTIGVDPISRREFWDILTDLHIAGVTILLSTAYMDEAERCSRVGLIHKGAIVKEGPPGDLRQLTKGELLCVETADLALGEKALRSVQGVYDVQIYGDRLHVFVDDAAECRVHVEAALSQAGVRFDNIHPCIPRLEEAFISLMTIGKA